MGLSFKQNVCFTAGLAPGFVYFVLHLIEQHILADQRTLALGEIIPLQLVSRLALQMLYYTKRTSMFSLFGKIKTNHTLMLPFTK